MFPNFAGYFINMCFLYLNFDLRVTHPVVVQDVCVEQMKPLCRLTAAARGFLTRRLLQTEKITHLRKTVQVKTHTSTS